MNSANWRTTLWGSIQSICMGLVTGAVVFPTDWKNPKQDILFVAVVILTGSGVKFALTAKDKQVTGGAVEQDKEGNIASPQHPKPPPPQAALPHIKKA